MRGEGAAPFVGQRKPGAGALALEQFVDEYVTGCFERREMAGKVRFTEFKMLAQEGRVDALSVGQCCHDGEAHRLVDEHIEV